MVILSVTHFCLSSAFYYLDLCDFHTVSFDLSPKIRSSTNIYSIQLFATWIDSARATHANDDAVYNFHEVCKCAFETHEKHYYLLPFECAMYVCIHMAYNIAHDAMGRQCLALMPNFSLRVFKYMLYAHCTLPTAQPWWISVWVGNLMRICLSEVEKRLIDW